MKASIRSTQGFSSIELLIVLIITGTIAAIGVPIGGSTLADFRLSGDAHALANSAALAKMRAAAQFSRARLYVDLTAGSHHLEVQKTGTLAWVADGGSTQLNPRTTLGFGAVNTPPPNTQATIAQAPACLDAAGHAIAHTACVVFNSRGIPVDATGAPIPTGAIYVAGEAGVYGVTISATGQIQLWRTTTTATAAWTLQ
jgi:Tfp pilus assembly protein FimT